MPALTVATAVLDDCHVASVVTGRLDVSDIAAVAANCTELPTAGAAPLTVSAVTVAEVDGGDVVDGAVDCEGEDGVDDVDDVDDGVVGSLVHADTAARPTTSRHDVQDTCLTS
jgi:hypothetical protein